MSVKIYTAYRFPASRLNDFLNTAERQQWPRIHQRFRELESGWKQEYVDKWVDENGPSSEPRYDLTLHAVRTASASPLRETLLCIDAGWRLWHRGRYFYAMPMGEPWTHRDIEWPGWVEEYCYWDNTDQPKDVSKQAWLKRGEVWEDINENHHAVEFWIARFLKGQDFDYVIKLNSEELEKEVVRGRASILSGRIANRDNELL